MKVAIAQLAPCWLDRQQTLDKVIGYCRDAASRNCRLVVFGEALLPGYPFWLERTGGAVFDSDLQKSLHARYCREAVQIERGDLEPLCRLAAEKRLAVYLGIIERPLDRGGHSLYCSLVYIDPRGRIGSVHRKLVPTYEERLSWSIGDGHGLVTHRLDDFCLGGLNCWENWMPLARAALSAQGEDLHIAVWPGGEHNTRALTPVIAREGRSFVISACGLMRPADVPDSIPELAALADSEEDFFANGGSCIAAPDGSWILEPQAGEEGLYTAELDPEWVFRERQNFDPAGHYSRPDVLRLAVNRQRQTSLTENQSPESRKSCNSGGEEKC